MDEPLLRKLVLSFAQLHILHYAKRSPVFGLWIMEELARHGYELGAGTLYPLLHQMETNGLLLRQEQVVDGKVRKYYLITQKGEGMLIEAKERVLRMLADLSINSE